MSRAGALLVWVLCLLATPLILVTQLVQATFGSINRSVNIAIGIDQTVNVLFGGLPDETISARAYRSGWIKAEAFINWLFRDASHCKASYEAEVARLHLPQTYRWHG